MQDIKLGRDHMSNGILSFVVMGLFAFQLRSMQWEDALFPALVAGLGLLCGLQAFYKHWKQKDQPISVSVHELIYLLIIAGYVLGVYWAGYYPSTVVFVILSFAYIVREGEWGKKLISCAVYTVCLAAGIWFVFERVLECIMP